LAGATARVFAAVPAVAAPRADDLRGQPRDCVLRPATQPAAPGRRSRDARRSRLAGAGEAAGLRELRGGGARRDDRLPHEHEAPAVVIEAPTRGERQVRTA